MTEFILGNIFVRDNGSPHETGWTMEGHCHNFDHATYVVRGKYRCRRWRQIVDADGKETAQWLLVADQIIQGPHFFLISAQDKHDFECIEGPGILHCIYSHRDPQTKEVVQHWNGWQGATV